MYLYDALQLFHVQPLRLNQFIHYVTVKKDEKYVSIRSYKGQNIGVTRDFLWKLNYEQGFQKRKIGKIIVFIVWYFPLTRQIYH